MLTFIAVVATLLIGFVFYGKYVDKFFGPDDQETPAIAINDGVDFVPTKGWRIFLIQLLNIAGLGPIFSALNGALSDLLFTCGSFSVPSLLVLSTTTSPA